MTDGEIKNGDKRVRMRFVLCCRLQEPVIPMQATGGADRTPRRTQIFSVLLVFVVFRTSWSLVSTFSHIRACGSRGDSSSYDSHKTETCCLCALAPKSLICTPCSTDVFWTCLISLPSAQHFRQRSLRAHCRLEPDEQPALLRQRRCSMAIWPTPLLPQTVLDRLSGHDVDWRNTSCVVMVRLEVVPTTTEGPQRSCRQDTLRRLHCSKVSARIQLTEHSLGKQLLHERARNNCGSLQ